MTYPLVEDLAANGIPIAVACRVLRFSKQAFYQWKANPVTRRGLVDAHLINTALDGGHLIGGAGRQAARVAAELVPVAAKMRRTR